MDVFQDENGFKNFNPSIAMHSYCLFSNNLHICSLRILVLQKNCSLDCQVAQAGPKRILRSSIVTGDVDFKPQEDKWKGNQAITTRRL